MEDRNSDAINIVGTVGFLIDKVSYFEGIADSERMLFPPIHKLLTYQ
jgi:hypothetical protein